MAYAKKARIIRYPVETTTDADYIAYVSFKIEGATATSKIKFKYFRSHIVTTKKGC